MFMSVQEAFCSSVAEMHAGYLHGNALSVSQRLCTPSEYYCKHIILFVVLSLLLLQKLAARNILVSEHEVCKVADLDLGYQSNGLEEDSLSSSANIEEGLKDPNRMLRWMAPEILLHRHFSAASDVWSYGVLMWEMFHPSQLPYQECDDRVCVERIVQGYTLSTPEACPEKVAKIMKACWYQNPASRPSFLYVSSLVDSFITEYNQY